METVISRGKKNEHWALHDAIATRTTEKPRGSMVCGHWVLNLYVTSFYHLSNPQGWGTVYRLLYSPEDNRNSRFYLKWHISSSSHFCIANQVRTRERNTYANSGIVSSSFIYTAPFTTLTTPASFAGWTIPTRHEAVTLLMLILTEQPLNLAC